MRQYKRRAENISKISLLIGTTILMHLMLTPLAYTGNLEPSSGKPHTSFTLSEDAYIINEVNNYELLSDVKIKSIVSRNLRDYDRLLKSALDTMVQPIISITILLIYTLTYFKKKHRRRSLIAFSLGGHAPPVFE
jgi:hypothetical protein